MSTMDQNPMTESDQPEEPTNRPMPADRMREWFSRSYAKRVTALSILITLLIIPMAWVVVHFMNLTGAPASPIMSEIEKTMLVFTIASAPLMGVTLAIILYSLLGWGGVSGDEPPMQESPALRGNRTATVLWISVTGILAFLLGTYNIRCAELCGLHHAYMESTITVVTEQQFESWIREQGGRRTV